MSQLWWKIESAYQTLRAWLRRLFMRRRKNYLATEGLLLLNREMVMLEMIKLGHMKVAGILRVPMNAVTPSVTLIKGLPQPRFEVNMNFCDGVTAAQVKEVMVGVYTDMKREMEERLAGLKQRRGQV